MTNYEFYLKCQEEGIQDFKTNADKARIRLIAENNCIIAEQEECVEMFKLGKDDFLQQKSSEKKQAKQADIEEQRKKETEQISEAIKISELFGRDKPIYFCQKEIDELYKALRKLNLQITHNDNLTSSMVKAYHVKEKDWAVHGGIASGIAGGAAGLATALDIQQQNVKIREHNDKVIKSAAQLGFQLSNNLYGEISKLKDKIEGKEKIRACHKKRLVEELPEIDLLEKLNPKIIEQKTTKTGALKLTVQTNAVGISIYDNVKATIDGSFKALLTGSNNNMIDEIYFYIPSIYGATKEHKVVGYSSKKIEKDIAYKIIFIPINLWAIETDHNIKYSEDESISANKKEIAEYQKKDIINQQKKISDNLKFQIDTIKNKELPIRKDLIFLRRFFGIICGLSFIIASGLMYSSIYTLNGSFHIEEESFYGGLALFCFSILEYILVAFFIQKSEKKFKQKKIKENEKRIGEIKAQAKKKEKLLKEKMKKIEEFFN